MVRRPRLERGDIVRVSPDPTQGHEQQGDSRPAPALSTAAFNAPGVAMVAPITQGGEFARAAGCAVPLAGCGTETQGVVLADRLRPMDLQARSAGRIGAVPQCVIDDALARIQAIFE